MKEYLVDGYWKDDGSTFSAMRVVVCSDETVVSDDIFYSFIDEHDLQDAKDIDNVTHEFVITAIY